MGILTLQQGERYVISSEAGYSALRKYLLKCFHTFVRDLGIVERQSMELCQSFEVFQSSIRDLSTNEIQEFELG